MTREEKHNFITELVHTIEASLLSDLVRVPDEWDGYELRQWTVDRFRDRALFGTGMTNSRLREYRNTVLVNNL